MEEVNNENNGGSGAGDVPAEEEIVRLRREREEYLDGWKRAKADFANYKKDEMKRLGEFSKFATEGLIRELLTVLDSFTLALGRPETKENETVERGLYLIRQQLEDALRQYGLARIPVAVGDVLNPAFHEAIVEVESDMPSGTIVDELEHGYTLQGKVIRPARVKVAK